MNFARDVLALWVLVGSGVIPRGDEFEEVLPTLKKPAIRYSPCLICHIPAHEQLAKGSHGEAGLMCAECHGPSQGHVDDEHNNVKPDRTFTDETVASLCGKCHTEQAERYAAAIAKADANAPPVPSCVACHGEHRIATREEARKALSYAGINLPH